MRRMLSWWKRESIIAEPAEIRGCFTKSSAKFGFSSSSNSSTSGACCLFMSAKHVILIQNHSIWMHLSTTSALVIADMTCSQTGWPQVKCNLTMLGDFKYPAKRQFLEEKQFKRACKSCMVTILIVYLYSATNAGTRWWLQQTCRLRLRNLMRRKNDVNLNLCCNSNGLVQLMRSGLPVAPQKLPSAIPVNKRLRATQACTQVKKKVSLSKHSFQICLWVTVMTVPLM